MAGPAGVAQRACLLAYTPLFNRKMLRLINNVLCTVSGGASALAILEVKQRADVAWQRTDVTWQRADVARATPAAI
jgi:hypothetical protein